MISQTAVDRLDEEFGLSASELRFMEALLSHSGLAYLLYSSTRLRAKLSCYVNTNFATHSQSLYSGLNCQMYGTVDSL